MGGGRLAVNPRFIAIKIVPATLRLWLIVTFAFIILRMSGDPIEAIVGDEADPSVIAYYHQKYGLDRPLHKQYIAYFINA